MSPPAAEHRSIAIEFHDVSYAIPGCPTLLSHLNLTIERGETLVLLGRSGAGKTTALKLINRLLETREGEVRVGQAIEEGTSEGLQTFDQALFDLLQRKAIGQEDALRFADSPNNLRLRMKGIR